MDNNPLENPELRIAVGQFLESPDLCRCLRVSRSWYSSFLPLVWRSLVLLPQRRIPFMVGSPRRPTVESLRRHSHLIKELDYFTTVWAEYGSIECPNLKSLEVHCNKDAITAAFHQYFDDDEAFAREERLYTAWTPPRNLHNLSALKVHGIEVSAYDSVFFWELFRQLRTCYMNGTIIGEQPDTSVTFRRLLKVEIIPKPGFSFEQQTRWISQCPNLVELKLTSSAGSHNDLDAFVARLAAGNCPNLCVLQMCGLGATDIQLAQAISGMKRATILDVNGCEFGELSFKALRRHFPTLEALVIFSRASSSPMVLEILTSCPHLEALCTGDIMGQDIIDSRPWPCVASLRLLRVSIRLTPGQDPDDQQRNVFRRLSQLVNLEQFDLWSQPPMNDDTKSLEFRLEKGLEQLHTMQNLKKLGFVDVTQNLTEADVMWMIRTWKNLRMVTGILTSDTNGNLGKLFTESDIRYTPIFVLTFDPTRLDIGGGYWMDRAAKPR